MRAASREKVTKQKFKPYRVPLFLGLALLPVSLTPTFADKPKGATPPPKSPSASIASQAKATILKRSRAVVFALKNDDTSTLSYYVHPDRKLRICPNFYISDEDLFFNRAQVKKLHRDRTVRKWGTEDPSDEPIKSTWKQFRDRYVYCRDFASLKKENILYNNFVSRGNTLEGLKRGFPNAIFVEYYFPGTKKYDEMDWRSLWLIWEKGKSRWYLAGIACNQWTP